MAQKIGELIAIFDEEIGELTDEDTIIVHPATQVAVDGKPTRSGGAWSIPIRFFEPGRFGMPVLSKRDWLNTHKPVIKVVYDEALCKAAGLDVD